MDKLTSGLQLQVHTGFVQNRMKWRKDSMAKYLQWMRIHSTSLLTFQSLLAWDQHVSNSDEVFHVMLFIELI